MRTYSRSQGWGKMPSTLDDVLSGTELYQKLNRLGFLSSEEMRFRAGTAKLYTRKTERPLKKDTLFPFDFCCVLTLSGFVYWIGLKTLEDALQFLKEIDAHVEQTVIVKDLDEITESLDSLARRLKDPTITINGFETIKGLLKQLIDVLGSGGPTPSKVSKSTTSGISGQKSQRKSTSNGVGSTQLTTVAPLPADFLREDL